MMMNTGSKISPRETLELHELLTFKNICATKTAAMVPMIEDEELKTMMQQDITTTQKQIKEIEGLLNKANTASFS